MNRSATSEPLGSRSSASRSVGSGATARAIVLGLVIAVFVNVFSPYTESVGFSNFSWSYLPEGAMAPFLVLLLANILCWRIAPNSCLTPAELLVVFVMALVANCTSLFLMYFHLSAIVSPLYYASPENRWQQELIPFLRPWLIVQDDHNAVKWFYQGLPKGQAIPWRDWLTPLSVWMPLLFAIQLVSYLGTVIFRKQWMEHEKLVYPLVQVPLELVRDSNCGSTVLLTSRFWMGVAGPLFLAILHAIRQFVPAFPGLPIDHLGCLNWGAAQLPAPFPAIPLCVSFLALSTGYFVSLDVLFSIWFLYLAVKILEEGVLTKLGLSIGYGGMFVWGNAALAWQSSGAFTVLVLTVLWGARRHLLVLAKALVHPDGSDRNELLTYRGTILLLACGLSVMTAWLWHSGMPALAVALFLPAVFSVYLGLARVVCQSGIFYVVPPVIAQNLCIYTLGSRRIGPQGMISLGLTYSWHGDVQTVLAALSAEGVRVQEGMKCSGKALTALVMAALSVGLVAAPLGIIVTGYRHGALSWNTWVYKGWGPATYNQVLEQVRNPFGFDAPRFTWFGVGAAAMLVLTALHRRFFWWPLHPIGLAVVSSFTMYAVYAGFFLAWVIKGLILRWGGFAAYRRWTPFFVGLAAGHYLGRAADLIVLTVARGHWTI